MRIYSALRRSGRIACITQPFEDHVGIQRITPRHLCNGNFCGHRLNTDRPLLLVSPKPLRAPNHPKPHSVRYPKWTLSHPLYPRQGSQAGRLHLNDDEDMRCQVMLRHTDGERLRDIYGAILTSASNSPEVLAASEVT